MRGSQLHDISAKFHGAMDWSNVDDFRFKLFEMLRRPIAHCCYTHKLPRLCDQHLTVQVDGVSARLGRSAGQHRWGDVANGVRFSCL